MTRGDPPTINCNLPSPIRKSWGRIASDISRLGSFSLIRFYWVCNGDVIFIGPSE